VSVQPQNNSAFLCVDVDDDVTLDADTRRGDLFHLTRFQRTVSELRVLVHIELNGDGETPESN
jgi:hypothetical protein